MRNETIAIGIEKAIAARRDRDDEYEAALRKTRAAGKPDPDDERIKLDAHGVRTLAGILRRSKVPDAFTDADLVEVHGSLVGLALAKLRQWPEFSTIATHRIDLRWVSRALVRHDCGLEDVLFGKTTVVGKEERLCWPVDEQTSAPSFRLTLSLPAVLLADDDQVERGLHELLVLMAVGSGGPVLRKPDIVGSWATFARYGLRDARQAQVYAHIAAHPSTPDRLRAFGFDAESGQGILLQPTDVPDVLRGLGVTSVTVHGGGSEPVRLPVKRKARPQRGQGVTGARDLDPEHVDA